MFAVRELHLEWRLIRLARVLLWLTGKGTVARVALRQAAAASLWDDSGTHPKRSDLLAEMVEQRNLWPKQTGDKALA